MTTNYPLQTSPSSQSLADKVFDWLTDQILHGSLRPGQWVSENEIARLLGVSRSPVREALRGLEREGIVEVRPRRGTVIKQFDADITTDLYRARQLVDAEMTRLAIENATDVTVVQLQRIVGELRTAVDDPPSFYEGVRHLWELLMATCPNRTLSDLVAQLWRRSISYRGVLLVGQTEPQDQILGFAERLLVCVEARDAEAGSQEMAGILEEVRVWLLANIFIAKKDGKIPRLII